MFQTTVREAREVPEVGYIHLVGVNSTGDARIGSYITDGNQEYEITSIPFMHRESVVPLDEVDICIRAGEYSICDIVGKTLHTVS